MLIIASFFFSLLFSFGVMEAVYINKVIIPDENVRITTKAIHLEIVTLKVSRDTRMEVTRIRIAMCIGFVFFYVFY